MSLDPEYPPRCAGCGHRWGMHDPFGLGRCLEWVGVGPGVSKACACKSYTGPEQ